jgi:hypothetical protein
MKDIPTEVMSMGFRGTSWIIGAMRADLSEEI